MKKHILILLFLTNTIFIFSQHSQNVTWFSIGAKGGFGSSLFFNQESFDDSKVTYEYFSPSYFTGANLGLLFGNVVGFSGEFSLNNLSQKYTIESAETFQREINIKSTDLAILLNLNASTGFYFDIGPKFSSVKSGILTTSSSSGTTNVDRNNKFRPEFTSIVLGLGLKPVRTDAFEMKLGIRGAYTLSSNFVNTQGYIIPADDNMLYSPNYSNEKTNPIQLMVTTEFTLIFGRFGKASCGKSRFILNF